MERLFVRFHIGRGGRFNNQGHLSFVNEDNFQDLISACADKLFDAKSIYDEETETETELPEDEWNYHDAGGKILVKGREAMEADTGRLDWDGLYDTDYVKTTDELNDNEIECLWEEYCHEAWMSDELKDEICTLKDKLRVHDIKRYQTNLECFCQAETEDGCSTCSTVDFDQQQGEYTRDEWKEILSQQDFCPLSIEKILDELESCYTNTVDFFKED